MDRVTDTTVCTHYADLYGRCIDCGKTWEQRATEATANGDETDGTGAVR